MGLETGYPVAAIQKRVKYYFYFFINEQNIIKTIFYFILNNIAKEEKRQRDVVENWLKENIRYLYWDFFSQKNLKFLL